jgi:hypothetical protein
MVSYSRDISTQFPCNSKLKLSDVWDLPQSELEDIVIHEMIHYFILLHNLKDSSPHGNIFKSLMHSINANHGRNITINRKLTGNDRIAFKAVKVSERIVVVADMPDGKLGVKIIPNNPERIKLFCSKLERSSIKYSLYKSSNSFFAQFPSSVALRFIIVEAELLQTALLQAQKISQNSRVESFVKKFFSLH